MWRALVLVPLIALLLVVLLSTFKLDWVPFWIPILLVALAALAAWNPAAALIAAAGATPVATWIGSHWNYTVAWPETLVIAFAAGWAIHGLRSRAAAPVPPLVQTAVALFASLVVGSVLVDLAMMELRLDMAGLLRLSWQYISRDYFVKGPAFPSVQAGALLLEGLLLLVVSLQFAASDNKFTARLMRALVAGTAAAAALNIVRLAQAAARTDSFWRNLAEYAATLRVNVHFGDANAAGSQFAMVLFVALGLVLAGTRRAWLWGASVALLASGLWISGSRAALLCAVAGAAVIFIGPRWGRARHTGITVLVAGALVAAAFVGVAFLPTRGAQQAVEAAMASRTGLIMTGLRMVRERPLFGIGLGEFHARSGEFSSPELLRLFPAARNENAHNNFLQVLAELGILGLITFVAVIGIALARGAAWLHERPDDPLRLACLGGLITFLFTCLGGHPLLMREPAYAFWLLLGIAAGSPAVWRTPLVMPSNLRGYLRLAVVALVLLSVPFRAIAESREANLEHVGIGVSKWQVSDDGVRYRWADDGSASVFVPGRGSGFVLLLRSEGTPARVELRFNGQLADIVNVGTTRWTPVRMLLPPNPEAPRYSRLDFRSTPQVKLMIGKVDPL